MIVQSKLECVHQYPEVDLVPGVNMIPDSIGRKLIEHKGWKELMSSKHPSIFGKVKILVPPAPDKFETQLNKLETAKEKAEAKVAKLAAVDLSKKTDPEKADAKKKLDEAKAELADIQKKIDTNEADRLEQAGKPESAVANLGVAEAVQFINKCSIVDQLDTIMLLDERAAIKNAVLARRETLARLAIRNEDEGGEGVTSVEDGAEPPSEFASDETL